MQQFWQWVIIIINIPSQRLRKYPFLLGRQSLLPVTCSQKVSLYFYKFNPSFQKVNPYLQKIKPSYGTVNPSFQKVNPFFQKVNPSFQKVNPYFQKVNPSHWKSIPIFGKQTSSGKEPFWIVNLQLSVSVLSQWSTELKVQSLQPQYLNLNPDFFAEKMATLELKLRGVGEDSIAVPLFTNTVRE